MTIKEFMNTVFETKVTIFSRGKVFDGSICSVMPGNKNWEQFANLKIVQTEAVAHYDRDVEIYLIVE